MIAFRSDLVGMASIVLRRKVHGLVHCLLGGWLASPTFLDSTVLERL